MSNLPREKACAECKRNGHDTTGNHMFLLPDGSKYMCNRIAYHENGSYYFEDLNGNALGKRNENIPRAKGLGELLRKRVKEAEEPSPPPAERKELFQSVSSTYRSVDPSTYGRYGVSCATNVSGEIEVLRHSIFSLEGKELAHKYRVVEPKSFNLSKKLGGEPIQLFGQLQFPRAKRLLITEGELDALSSYDMLRKYKVVCVSLPQGANVKALADNLKYLGNFKEVYACMDQDEPGKKVEKEIASLVPHCRFLSISEKDPNDMLTKGKESEFISAFWDAKVWKPESIVRVSDIMKDVLKKPTYGVPWPWETLTKATYGRNPGQGMYVGAGVKIGKSEFINELIAFDVRNKRSIAILKYEEPPVMTVKRVSGKLDGIAYHRPGATYSDKDLEATAISMDPYLYMYPAFGRATWESTREYIRYCAVMGCTTIIIDPITKLTNHLSSSDTETELRLISDELACMAMDLGFFYVVTCHLKSPLTGPPHERGGKVQSAQYRGSRSMMEATFYMLGIERNKDPSLPEEERNTSTFVLLEDRNFGNTVQFPVVYNPLTQAYQEPITII